MSELVTVTLKMTTELRDRLKARATAEGTSVSALLIDGVSGAFKPAPRVAELEATVKEMETTIERLTVDRNQWRDRAKAIVSVTSNAEGRRLARANDPMGRSPHQSGPLMASAVPDGLTDEVKPNFRPTKRAR